jgi:ribosomal protein S18 acetylase RimI-like enzyme
VTVFWDGSTPGSKEKGMGKTEIQYQIKKQITADDFIDVLRRSTLGERRPIEDSECVKGMLDHADLLVTAWDGKKLVGVSRSVTDFHYACYLSDLAVDTEYQKHGIGKKLIDLTQKQLGPQCKLILISAPAANEYYPKIGFDHQPRTWVLPRDKQVR